jgi:hypothetical protein
MVHIYGADVWSSGVKNITETPIHMLYTTGQNTQIMEQNNKPPVKSC